MAYDRFLIAPLQSGLITDVPAWQIPEDAFQKLSNAYIHKGVVRKRFGSRLVGGTTLPSMLDQLASRLRVNIGTTDAVGYLTGVAPGVLFNMGQMFSIGDEIFTVNADGSPVVMLTTGASTTHTFNTTTGVYEFDGAAGLTLAYWYPSHPVMGFAVDYYRTMAFDMRTSYAFDLQFIYRYSIAGFWNREGSVVLSGDDSNFVMSANWTGRTLGEKALFISNFKAAPGTPPPATNDPMYVYRNSAWAEFRPVFRVLANVADGYVASAKLIIPFKNRLLLLNTVEVDVAGGPVGKWYPNRCRFSHNGVPFPADVPNNVASAVSSAWLEGSQVWTIGATTRKSDGAGWIDAPTTEEIVAAEFIKDRLIVYFEKSTWELAYTGNQVLPFVWQQINTEIGCVSSMSPVPFDKAVLAVGENEIHGCSGSNVSSVSQKISDDILDIRVTEKYRITGIKDDFTEVVYWAYPSIGAHTSSSIYPNKVFIYNYVSDSWGTADDVITAFGYFEGEEGIDWEGTELRWREINFLWRTGTTQNKYRNVIAGNQQGFVFICDSDISVNEGVMQVTNIGYIGTGIRCTIRDHTLNNGDFIRFMDLSGVALTGDGIYRIAVVDADTIIVYGTVLTGVYRGGGRAARVSRIDILSKQWNFYVDKGSNFFLAKIDFAVQKTDGGAITVDYFPSSTEQSATASAYATGSILGNGMLQTYPFDLYPLEQAQKRLWHPVYFQTEGECVQIRLVLDNDQMLSREITSSDFRLEGLVVHARKTSERLQ